MHSMSMFFIVQQMYHSYSWVCFIAGGYFISSNSRESDAFAHASTGNFARAGYRNVNWISCTANVRHDPEFSYMPAGVSALVSVAISYTPL